MKYEKILLVCIMIMLMLASACANVEMTSNPNTSSEPKSETDESIIPKTHPFIVLKKV